MEIIVSQIRYQIIFIWILTAHPKYDRFVDNPKYHEEE